jgi:excisionase family DNA binding protein
MAPQADSVNGFRRDGPRSASRSEPVPRVAFTKREAAAALGISIDSFERYVQHELRVVRCGRLRLFPVNELERWIAENAERPLEG